MEKTCHTADKSGRQGAGADRGGAEVVVARGTRTMRGATVVRWRSGRSTAWFPGKSSLFPHPQILDLFILVKAK